MRRRTLLSLMLVLFIGSLVALSPAAAQEHNTMDKANERAYLMGLIEDAEATGNPGLKEWALKRAEMYNIMLGTNGRKISVEASGEGIWMMPGLRELDPHIFGTPQNPDHTQLLPVEQRMVSADGTRFTTTAMPGPFSNNIAEIDNGHFNLYAEDNTLLDHPDSEDQAELEAVFYGPMGEKEYRVTLDTILPVGPEHNFFGGVGTDVLIHGDSNIGEPLMPKLWNYTTAWGLGELYIDGEMVDSNRLIHLMVSQRVRDENFQLGLNVAMPNQLEIHLILPPTKVEEGAVFDNPVPTGVMLPNGEEQPFIHVNFYENIEVTGNRFLE